MSKYEKAHQIENCDDFSIFLWAFVNKLWLMEKKERKKERKKDKMEIFVVEFLDFTKG